MDGWKLLGRSKDNLENEIKIIEAIRKDISMNSGLELCKNLFKNGRVQRKTYIGGTFEKDIKELDARKASKYFGIEDSLGMEYKKEEEKLRRNT
jgi:hypothetical protein